MATKLVIPRKDPGLDEVATAYAYSKFLKQNDEETTAAVFGDIDKKAERLLESLDESISDASYHLYSMEQAVLVKAEEVEDVSTRIREKDVSEVITNDGDFDEDRFPNADLRLEEAATTSAIIAERFRESDNSISEEKATVLYGAIMIETDGLEDAKELDREAAEWLEERSSKSFEEIKDVVNGSMEAAA
ncbi:MAG: hypothetical protein ABEJ03_02660 [Candidatus Nanohaloarchaea archaeon]